MYTYYNNPPSSIAFENIVKIRLFQKRSQLAYWSKRIKSTPGNGNDFGHPPKRPDREA